MGTDLGVDMLRMMESIPLERILGLSGGLVQRDQIEQLVAAINANLRQ